MWKKKLTAAIGGLENIGFVNDGGELLILSSQGIGVIDCDSGELLYRSNVEWWPLFDQTSDTLANIPGYYSSSVKIFGLHSEVKMGTKTDDSWEVVASEPEADNPPFEQHLVSKIYLADSRGNRTLVATDGPCD